MWNEARLVAPSQQIEGKHLIHRSTTARKIKTFHDKDAPDKYVHEMIEAGESPEEAHFRKHMSYVVLDYVNGGLTVRFRAAKQISDAFSLLWKYQEILREELMRKAAYLTERYFEDICSEDLVLEMNDVTG